MSGHYSLSVADARCCFDIENENIHRSCARGVEQLRRFILEAQSKDMNPNAESETRRLGSCVVVVGRSFLVVLSSPEVIIPRAKISGCDTTRGINKGPV